tara:strand:+ start:536 stop:934 length:399 start_codon:yes stop_codon:yes gene_type:complete
LLFGSTEQKNKNKQKEEKIFLVSREKEREMPAGREIKICRRQILTFLSSSPMMIKDDDLFAENATFNAPTCSQTHFTHTFIKYVCICSTTIHRVPRERRREICFVEETIEENSTMQFTRRGREEIGRGFKQK